MLGKSPLGQLTKNPCLQNVDTYCGRDGVEEATVLSYILTELSVDYTNSLHQLAWLNSQSQILCKVLSDKPKNELDLKRMYQTIRYMEIGGTFIYTMNITSLIPSLSGIRVLNMATILVFRTNLEPRALSYSN